MPRRALAARRRGSPLRAVIQRDARVRYRGAILDGAERVLPRVGYHETKMADIAAEAGVSVGTLYNHFDSKEAVFASLVERGREQFVRALDSVQPELDPIRRIAHFVRTACEFADQRGAMFAIYAQVRGGGMSCLDRDEGSQKMHERLRGALTEAVEHGVIRADIDPARLANALTGIMKAETWEWLAGGRGAPLAERAEAILTVFFDGAKTR